MTILYIHQYFKTPAEPGGTRSYWIAKKLVSEGHKVIMLTASDTQTTKRKRIVHIDGIEVIYLKVSYDQKMGIWKRLVSFIGFMLRSSWVAFSLKNIDLVFATSTPLTVGVPALLLKWFKKIPFIFEVRDLWPEVPIQMKGLTNPLAIKMAVWLEKTIYRNAKHVIALSPGMQDGVTKYVQKSKTSVIPNMAKTEVFYPREINTSLLKELGLKSNSFKIIHFGSLGIANEALSILKSAQSLRNNDLVEFIFIGGGAQETELVNFSLTNKLKNVHFLGKYSMAETSEIVNLCDASIVSFKNIPILYTNSPNKFFDSLAAGKPVFVNSAGWTKNLVETADCGFYVNPEIPLDLADKIIQLQNNPEMRIRMGKKARELALRKFDKDSLCNQISELIIQL